MTLIALAQIYSVEYFCNTKIVGLKDFFQLYAVVVA